MTDLQIDKWVQEANDDTNREFRQAVHTTLLAISSDNALKNNMVLKGGILLAIRYRSNRFTKDIDLSTTNHLSSMVPEDIISEINQSLALAVNILNYDLDCIVQGWKIEPRTENVTYPSIKITIGYAYKGTNKHKRLLAKQSPTALGIDYSLNESLPNIEVVELTEGDEILVYSIIDVISEKFRSLIQQEERNRYRRQDIFDIFLLLDLKNSFDESDKILILDSLIKKSQARGISPSAISFDSDELKNRAERDYPTLLSEVEGPLPDFATMFGRVADFYRSLPWPPTT